MIYFIRDDNLTTRREEYTPAELIESYETGRLHIDALVAAKGDSGWHRLDSMLPLLRQDASDMETRPPRAREKRTL
jgi:hypothetical protein